MEQSSIQELYIQYLTGVLTVDETRELEQRLETDEPFRQQWELLKQEAEALGASAYLQRIDSAAVLQRIKFKRKTNFQVYKLLAAAAVLLLLSVGGYWFLHQPPKEKSIPVASLVTHKAVQLESNGATIQLADDSGQHTIALKNATINAANGSMQYASLDTSLNTLSVPAGQTYHIRLSDGSEVWLNASTRLRFPFHFTGKREVFVEGEAYFRIAADARHPFIVNTPLTAIQVLGTSFNVNTYQPNKVKTALVDGKVITDNRKGQLEELKPGIQADYTNGEGFSTSRFDPEEVLSWKDDIYYYHSKNLAALLEEASRFYGIRFTAVEDLPASQTVTGLMDRKRLEDFLSDLKATAKLNFTVKNNEVQVHL